MSQLIVNRYSEAELEEFRQLLEHKLDEAKHNLQNLREQIIEITENAEDEHGGDWIDDSSVNNDVEMLNNMAIRQRRYIQDLENALIRIRNKSYGICAITGQLIDKRRLMAVPTTTKSLQAKVQPKVAVGRSYTEEEAESDLEPSAKTLHADASHYEEEETIRYSYSGRSRSDD